MDTTQSYLLPNERLDDLLTHEMKIIQSDEVFSFSLDAVLLARFCNVPRKGTVIDLCSGNGVIPLLLSTRTQAKIIGIEIQDRLAHMASRNVDLNQLNDRIDIIHADLKDAPQMLGHGICDLVTVNPPYLPIYSGIRNMNEYVAAARHEIYCNLEDVIAVSSKLVRPGGKVAMVHRPSRLADIICMMRRFKLEPKRVRFVHPRIDEEANMVLIEASRDGNPEIRMLPPIIVYNSNNEYCDELMNVYYGHATELNVNEG